MRLDKLDGRPLINRACAAFPNPRQRHALGETSRQPFLYSDRQVERLAQSLRGQAAAQQWCTVKRIDCFVRHQPLRKQVGLFPPQGRQTAIRHRRPVLQQIGVAILQAFGMTNQQQANFRLNGSQVIGRIGFGVVCLACSHKRLIAVASNSHRNKQTAHCRRRLREWHQGHYWHHTEFPISPQIDYK